MAALYGNLMDEVPLVVNKISLTVRGFEKLGKAFKSHAYKSASLQVRASDPDAVDGELPWLEAESSGGAASSGSSDVNKRIELRERFEKLPAALDEVSTFFSANSCLTLPVMAQMPTALATQGALVASMQGLQQLPGGAASDTTEPLTMLIDKIIERVEAIIPAEWLDVVGVLEDAVALGAIDPATKDAFAKQIQLGSGLTIDVVRRQVLALCFHMLHSLGSQMYLLNTGPTTSPRPYMQQFSITIAHLMCAKLELTAVDSLELQRVLSALGRSGSPWQDFVRATISKIISLTDFVHEHDGRAYEMKRSGLVDALQASKSNCIVSVLEKFGLGGAGLALDAAIDAFPDVRAKFVGIAVAKMDELHTHANRSISILKTPVDALLDELLVLYPIPAAVAPPTAIVAVESDKASVDDMVLQNHQTAL